MVQSLIHVGIGSMDFDKMLAFYRDVIGLTVTHTKDHPNFPGGKVAFLSAAEGEVIELIQYPNPRPPLETRQLKGNAGLNHFGFKVDDMDYEYKRLEELGVKFEDPLPPKEPGKNRVCHFLDPEGNRTGITEVAK